MGMISNTSGTLILLNIISLLALLGGLFRVPAGLFRYSFFLVTLTQLLWINTALLSWHGGAMGTGDPSLWLLVALFAMFLFLAFSLFLLLIVLERWDRKKEGEPACHTAADTEEEASLESTPSLEQQESQPTRTAPPSLSEIESFARGKPGWIREFLEPFVELSSESERRSFSWMHARGGIQKNWLSRETGPLPREEEISIPSGYDLKEFLPILQTNNREYSTIFGVEELLCFSPSFHRLLELVMLYSRSPQAVLFEGETGTGRELLARAMHSYRGGGRLVRISCMGQTKESLASAIGEFLALPDNGKAAGLLLCYLDHIPGEDFSLLEPLLELPSGSRYLYFTAGPHFSESYALLPGDILYRLKQLTLRTLPLRERPEDLFYQVLWFVHNLKRETGVEVEGVSSSFMEEAIRHTWPGNSLELREMVRRSFALNRSERLEECRIERVPELVTGERGGLSPLEESEKTVIVNYLKKNGYNKSQTIRDLKITINTLNAKIKRYDIRLP